MRFFFVVTNLFLFLSLYSCNSEEKEYVIEESGLSYYRITNGNKHGIKDSETEKTIVPVSYDSVVFWWQSSGKDIGLQPMDWFIAYKDGVAELYSPNGNVLISKSQGYEKITPLLFRTSVYESLWYYVEKNGKRGLCNSKGKGIIPCKYKSIYIYRIPQKIVAEGSYSGLTHKKTNNGETVYQDEVIYCDDGKTKSVYDTKGMVVIQSGRYSDISYIASIGTYYFECKDKSNDYLSIRSKNGKMLIEENALLIKHKVSRNGNVYFFTILNNSDDKIIYDRNGRQLFRGSRDECDDYVYYNL